MSKRSITDRFTVTYRIDSESYEDAKAVALSLQVEQTVEFPLELLVSEWIRDKVVGQLELLEPVGPEEQGSEADGRWRAVISYGSELTAGEVTQFLNVVFGNSSLQPGIWVEHISISPSLRKLFAGPRFGLEGIRRLTGVPAGPMLQAVIKPMGLSPRELAGLCRAYTRGGADVIKDDHGITNQTFAPFAERVRYCAEAVREENLHTGRNTLYAANVTADGEQLIERAYQAKALGATALMAAPGIVGFDRLRQLAEDKELGLPLISHPALLGGFVMPGRSGITAPIWMGLMPRLCGADITIFVSYGGRFTFTPASCQAIVDRLKEENGGLKASCPGPGGGVSAARLPELMKLYGPDTMYLVGGDMYRRGPDLAGNVRYFIELLRGQGRED